MPTGAGTSSSLSIPRRSHTTTSPTYGFSRAPTDTARLLTGRGFTSLPRTLTAGPLSIDKSIAGALLDAAIDWTGRKESGRLQIRTYVPDLQHQSERLLGGPHGVGYVVELPEHP